MIIRNNARNDSLHGSKENISKLKIRTYRVGNGAKKKPFQGLDFNEEYLYLENLVRKLKRKIMRRIFKTTYLDFNYALSNVK